MTTEAPAGAGVAAAYTAAVNAGDVEALRALHEADARIWHNTDGREQTVDENLAVFGWLHRTLPDLALADVRTTAVPDGFVQRHTMVATTGTGSVRVPSCLVVTLSPAGRIRRVEEYLDSAGAALLRR